MIKKCLGCGESFESDKDICERCFKLKYYGEYKVVNKNNDDFVKILDEVTNDDLVIYISSLLNLDFEYINKFNNVIIVLTKRDLLPKSVNDNKLIDYIKEEYNCLDTLVISSIKNYNLDNLISKIKKYKKNKIYFIGKTNSGKSTLINKLIKNYSNNNIDVTTSLYPNTTTNKIEIEISDLKIIDTPGYLGNNSILNYLELKDIKRLTPKKEIKPKTYQLKGKGSLLIDNLIQLDYDTISTSATFYFANNIDVKKVSKDSKFKISKSFRIKNKDIVIEDLGFIKFTNLIKLNILSLNDINIKERKKLI